MSATTVPPEIDAPVTEPTATVDVRQSPPPEPLRRTLEKLESMDGGVLLQYNDRVPQMLFPKLDDRGFDYDYTETDDGAVTAIWEAE